MERRTPGWERAARPVFTWPCYRRKVHAGRTRSPNVLHVLKRWAAWPRGNRWLAGIAAVVLGLAIAWVPFVPIADWIAHHDVGSVKGLLHETAVDNARGRLLTLAAGLLAAGALVFTALNFNLLRRNSQQADRWQRRAHELTEQGQVTDRYTKAIEQLGSDKLDVRIGGIYALERIARDSGTDQPAVVEVLAAFIREHSREQWPPPDHPASRDQERSTRPDVQAAAAVLGHRDPRQDKRRIHLNDADLAGVHLRDANLAGTDLRGADFTGAVLREAHLESADLRGADLTHADLSRANLADTYLTGANLTGAQWPDDAPVPEGWKRESSGRLLRADVGPGSAEAT
jgi:hypothetical protein